MTGLKLALLLAALIVAAAAGPHPGSAARNGIAALAAMAMGPQTPRCAS